MEISRFSDFFNIFLKLFTLASLSTLLMVIGVLAIDFMVLTAVTNYGITANKKLSWLGPVFKATVSVVSIALVQVYLVSIHNHFEWLREVNLQLILLFYFLLIFHELTQFCLMSLSAIYIFVRLYILHATHGSYIETMNASIGLIIVIFVSFIGIRQSEKILANINLFLLTMVGFSTGWWLLLMSKEQNSVMLFLALIIKFVIYMSIVHFTFRVRELQFLHYERLVLETSSDYLTGVKNRAAFDRDFNKFQHATLNDEKHLAMILFDIDRFKSINDTYGHSAGDYVLKKISQAVNDVLNTHKSVQMYRLGGEEFGVLLPNHTLDQAKEVGKEIDKSISEQNISVQSVDLKITISSGIGEYDRLLDQTKINFYNRVDQYLYDNKRKNGELNNDNKFYR